MKILSGKCPGNRRRNAGFFNASDSMKQRADKTRFIPFEVTRRLDRAEKSVSARSRCKINENANFMKSSVKSRACKVQHRQRRRTASRIFSSVKNRYYSFLFFFFFFFSFPYPCAVDANFFLNFSLCLSGNILSLKRNLDWPPVPRAI